MVAVLVGEHVALGERAALRAEPRPQLVEEVEVEVDELVGRAVERTGRRARGPAAARGRARRTGPCRPAGTCSPDAANVVGPVRLDAVDVAEDPAVVAGVGVLPGLAVGGERRAARAGHGARFEERSEVARVAAEQDVGEEQDEADAPPPPMARPPRPPMPRRSVIWPGSSWAFGLKVMGSPRTGTEARIVGERSSHRRTRPSMQPPRIRVANDAWTSVHAEFTTDGRSGAGPARPYRLVIANGPPDTETLDRRRVDPPAGCRAAAEPAHLPQRRSVDDLPATTAIPSSGGRRSSSVRQAAARHVPPWSRRNRSMSEMRSSPDGRRCSSYIASSRST